MKILLVEDEVKVASFIRQGLKEHSYEVDIAHNGTKGLNPNYALDFFLILQS